MAKLSAEVLEEARNFIRAKDIEGFMAWVKKHAPFVTHQTVRDTYEKIFKWQDTEKGLKLFDKVFPDMDMAKDIREGLFKLAMKLMVLLGALGGIVYLFQSCFGR